MRLPLCAVIALLLIAISVSRLRAAEVECVHQYDGKPIPDEFVRKLWPSGFRPVAGMCQAGYMHGAVARGDYEKVRTFYAKGQNMMTVFYIASPGGDVNEAMKIGRLFRQYLITAFAPSRRADGQFFLAAGLWMRELCTGGPECVCASACALIWFGAVDRSGIVGLHRPRIDDPGFKSLPPAEAAQVYRRVLDEIARYLDEMEAPRPMIDAMVATDSSDIRWVDTDSDHLELAPSYAEWRKATCEQLTRQESETMLDLNVAEQGRELTTNEKLLLKFLDHKAMTTTNCNASLRFSHVEQLSPP